MGRDDLIAGLSETLHERSTSIIIKRALKIMAWTKIKTAAAAIGLAAGFGPSVQAAGAETGPPTNRWESAIAAFEAMDRTNPPPRQAILFVGSSSIRLWPNLSQDFPGHKVIQRGFGGSELSDAVTFADRIVLPYRPPIILVYAGDNDIANGKSPERVLADLKAFTKKVHAALPQTRIGFIAIKPCPARKAFLRQVKDTNRLIKEYIGQDTNLFFVDVFTPMLDPDGGLRPELLGKDGLHLNEKGYALWASIIRPVLDKYDPPAGQMP
jgi:lysophospholipase L1-like esterase